MIISSAFGWFARRYCSFLISGFGVHTYLNRDEARYGKVDVFVGGRKAVQAALIIYQSKDRMH